MNIYCMRHGRTNYNDLCLCNDDPAQDVHLTEVGIKQAQSAALALRDIEFERIWRIFARDLMVSRYRIILQRLAMILSKHA